MARSVRAGEMCCMKNGIQNLEPRSQLITARTREILRSTKLCVRKFATCVAENYMERTSLDERIVRFYIGNGSIDSALRAEKRNAQLINRFLAGAVKFPCDLEESWIHALPDPARGELVRDLAARYGLSGASMPGASPHHALAHLSNVLSDAGRTAQALAPLFARGVLDGANVQQMRKSLKAIDDNITDLVSLRSQVARDLDAHEAELAVTSK